jgi:erythronate-4-phosphate dehydrogenase
MKIVVDADIPYIKGVTEQYFEVVYKKGSDFSANDVRDASALVVRTRTRCNRELLAGSSVQFIASATIGLDHIDEEWCNANGVYVENAAGCNAWGVVQHVLTTIFIVAVRRGISLRGKTIGIIGAGNVGERLAVTAPLFGLNVLRCDPPLEKLQRNGGGPDYYTMDYLLKHSDIVTLHVPLTSETRGMADSSFFSKMRDGAVFLNTSRGEVVNDEAIMDYAGPIIIDVWNREPEINRELLEKADIATPHIAGYSAEGKVNATVMSLNSLGRFFAIGELEKFSYILPPAEVPLLEFDEQQSFEKNVADLLENIYPVLNTDNILRESPGNFEEIRSKYRYRREIPQQLFDFIEKRLNFKE